MVIIEEILADVFELSVYEYNRPACYNYELQGRKKRGRRLTRGIHYDVEKETAYHVVFRIRHWTALYFLKKPIDREFFGFHLKIDKFVYSYLYVAVAAYLYLLDGGRRPLWFAYLALSRRKFEGRFVPYRYYKALRFVDSRCEVLGKLIIEEWLKMKRKENPSFMLEMW